MLGIIDKVRNWLGQGSRSTLQKNAEKALQIKREAGPQTNIPEHRTSHDGGVDGPQIGATDTAVGREPTHASNLGRSHDARSDNG